MTSKPLPYIAPLHGTLGLRYAPDQNYALHAEIVWSAAKTRIDPTQEFGTGAYGEVNIGAEVALAPWVGEYIHAAPNCGLYVKSRVLSGTRSRPLHVPPFPNEIHGR